VPLTHIHTGHNGNSVNIGIMICALVNHLHRKTRHVRMQTLDYKTEEWGCSVHYFSRRIR